MKKLTGFTLALIFSFSLLVSCGGSPKVPQIPPEDAAKMAFEMKQNPDAIADVLKGNSVSIEGWKVLLISISEDSLKSAIFTKELENLEGKGK